MLPFKSRGQLLVKLVNSSKRDEDPPEIKYNMKSNQFQESVPDKPPAVIFAPNSGTDQDSALPIIQLLDYSASNKIISEPNDLEIPSDSSLAYTINDLFPSLITTNDEMSNNNKENIISNSAGIKIQSIEIINNNTSYNKANEPDADEIQPVDDDGQTNDKTASAAQVSDDVTDPKNVPNADSETGSEKPANEDSLTPDYIAQLDQTSYEVNDPDYIADGNNNSDADESKGRPKKGRKRKFESQNKTIRKKKANSNQEYYSAKGKKVEVKEFKSIDCKCPAKCTEKIPVDQQKKEFQKFWTSGSYETRCAIIQGCVVESQKKRSYSTSSKRLFTRKYKLCDLPVCKKAFLSTLGISQSRIDVALKKKQQTAIKDNRGVNSGGRNAITNEKELQIKNFIDSLPKYSSHYCRDSTSAIFLAPNLNLTSIYNLYKEKHENHVSFSRFRLYFYTKYNLRFKKPQKDTCLRCDLYKAQKTAATGEKLVSLEEEHNKHLDHAYKMRDQMKKDLNTAKTNSNIETLTFDLEKTHCLPRLPTGIVYYKRQLNLHNLGIHCGSNGKGYFYIWLEHEAGRGTQEVGSCLKKFTTEHLKPDVTHLILWADSCGGQNRSIKMVLMLLHILHNHETLQKITIRFLQPGHTYLPNDSEFGDVECALKSQIRLYTADDYISVMENCRRKNKFVVTKLISHDFKSVTPLLDRITNRKSDTAKNKISWLSTFEIELRREAPSLLFMKSKLEEEPQIIDISKGTKGRKQKLTFNVELPVLYPNSRELSAAKIQDLKELLKLIPADAKHFYSFLKNVPAGDFTDDADGLGHVIDYDIDEDCIED